MERGTRPHGVDRIVDASMLRCRGAMLQAGLGHLGFDDVVEHVTAAASRWAD